MTTAGVEKVSHFGPHPLLIDHFTTQIMQYLYEKAEDRPDFLNCRLVCKNWEETCRGIWEKEEKFVEVASDVKLGELLDLLNAPLFLPPYFLSKLRIEFLWRGKSDNVITDGQLVKKLLQLLSPNLEQLEIRLELGLSEDRKWAMFSKDDALWEGIHLVNLERLKISGNRLPSDDKDERSQMLEQSQAVQNLLPFLLTSPKGLKELDFNFIEPVEEEELVGEFTDDFAGMILQFGKLIAEYVPRTVTILDVGLENLGHGGLLSLAKKNLPLQSLTARFHVDVGPTEIIRGVKAFLFSLGTTLQQLKIVSFEYIPKSIISRLAKFPLLQKFEFSGCPTAFFTPDSRSNPDQEDPPSYFDALKEITNVGAEYPFGFELVGPQIVPKALKIIHLVGNFVSQETVHRIAQHYKRIDKFECEDENMDSESSVQFHCVFQIGQTEDGPSMRDEVPTTPVNKMLLKYTKTGQFMGLLKPNPDQMQLPESVEEFIADSFAFGCVLAIRFSRPSHPTNPNMKVTLTNA